MNKFFLIGGAAALGFLSGRFEAPPKIVEKEKEKIVYREKVDEQKDRDKTTFKKEIRLPNGTVTIKTVTRAATSTRRTTAQEVESAREREKETTSSLGPILQGIIGVTPGNLIDGFDYGASLTVPIPILGLPIYGGGWLFIRQDFKFGLSAGVAL